MHIRFVYLAVLAIIVFAGSGCAAFQGTSLPDEARQALDLYIVEELAFAREYCWQCEVPDNFQYTIVFAQRATNNTFNRITYDEGWCVLVDPTVPTANGEWNRFFMYRQGLLWEVMNSGQEDFLRRGCSN